jgi:hypothetical protein
MKTSLYMQASRLRRRSPTSEWSDRYKDTYSYRSNLHLLILCICQQIQDYLFFHSDNCRLTTICYTITDINTSRWKLEYLNYFLYFNFSGLFMHLTYFLLIQLLLKVAKTQRSICMFLFLFFYLPLGSVTSSSCPIPGTSNSAILNFNSLEILYIFLTRSS